MAIVHKPTNITKYTVQEALNRDQFQDYAAAFDNSVSLSSATIISGIAFPTAYGSASIFDKYDNEGNPLVYSKVTVESSNYLWIELGTVGTSDIAADFGERIYIIAASLPITFTGYNITDLKIETAGSQTLGIIAWR